MDLLRRSAAAALLSRLLACTTMNDSPAAAERVPPALPAQLAPGGRLVIPVGDAWQELEVHRRTPSGVAVERAFPVRFVPLVGAD
jgi:protein-L-isoaspartate(D-aspartate) O-methyltransferase